MRLQEWNIKPKLLVLYVLLYKSQELENNFSAVSMQFYPCLTELSLFETYIKIILNPTLKTHK